MDHNEKRWHRICGMDSHVFYTNIILMYITPFNILTYIIQGKKFTVTKYSNIITKYGAREFIPGIRTPFHCKDICLLINGCKYWTHHDKSYNPKFDSSCAIVNGFNFIDQTFSVSRIQADLCRIWPISYGESILNTMYR